MRLIGSRDHDKKWVIIVYLLFVVCRSRMLRSNWRQERFPALTSFRHHYYDYSRTHLFSNALAPHTKLGTKTSCPQPKNYCLTRASPLLTMLLSQGPVREDTEDECRTVSLHAGNDNTVGRQALSIAYIQARTEGHCIPCYQQKQATGHLIHVTSDIPRNIGGARSSRREESRPGVVCDADNRSSEQV